MKRAASVAIFSLAVLLALLVAVLSARYLLPQPAAPAPPMIHQLAERPLAVLAHVGGGIVALALGPFQLITRTGPRRTWHRWSGRIYVAACLIGASGGLLLALHADSGLVSRWGFGLLAAAWAPTTLIGWRQAVRRQSLSHRRWMLRSLALTFAAVTLRILLPLSSVSGIAFIDAYPVISFLCWIPNLIIMEAWIRLTPSLQR